jgi:hypothetical protein
MSDDRDRCPSVRGTAEYGGRVRSPFERQSARLGVGPVRWLALKNGINSLTGGWGGAHRIAAAGTLRFRRLHSLPKAPLRCLDYCSLAKWTRTHKSGSVSGLAEWPLCSEND